MTALHDPVRPAPAHDPQVHVLGAARLLAGADRDRPVDHAAHRALAGPLSYRSHAWLCDAARSVGLLGRGGAAFPVGAKLSAIAPGRRVEVLANGSETEPASWKDRILMRRAPHRVLDGVLVVAAALHTRAITIAVHDPVAAAILSAACRERPDAHVVRVVAVPGGFVGGEIRALINGIDGRPAVPDGRRVLPTVRGVGRRPTFAANVETFAQLGLLSTLGPRDFASVGSGAEAGTSLVTMLGDLPRRGVAEVPTGIPLHQLSGRTGDRPVLLGGYHGTWARVGDQVLDRTALHAGGATWGAGVVAVLPEQTCALGEVARVASWLASQSAGQCGPCLFGLASIADDLQALAGGRSIDLRQLRRRVGLVDGRGACAHPSGIVRFVASALTAMADEVEIHRRGGCGRPVLGVLPVTATYDGAA